MLAVYGFALLGATFLLLGYGITVFRHPHPPQWTKRFMAVETFGVVLTAMVSSGIGLLVKLAAQFDGFWMYAAGAGSLIGAVVLFTAIWRALGINRKLAAYASQAPAATAMGASAAYEGGSDDPASPGTDRGGGGRRPKHAA